MEHATRVLFPATRRKHLAACDTAPPVSLIHSGDWKLMEYLEDGHLELYNLRNDIGETKNLATEISEKAKALHARLVAWRAEVKAPMPAKNVLASTPAADAPKKRKGKSKPGGE